MNWLIGCTKHKSELQVQYSSINPSINPSIKRIPDCFNPAYHLKKYTRIDDVNLQYTSSKEKKEEKKLDMKKRKLVFFLCFSGSRFCFYFLFDFQIFQRASEDTKKNAHLRNEQRKKNRKKTEEKDIQKVPRRTSHSTVL